MIDIKVLKDIEYLVGNSDTVCNMLDMPAMRPFSDQIMDFLNEVSRELMTNKDNQRFSDVITFAFWIRKASLNRMKSEKALKGLHLGRGLVFHIAPSNVPVNFAYSLAVGLLTGNANIVRVPSKEFEQVSNIIDAIKSVLTRHRDIKPYIVLVKYGHTKEVNDLFSECADVRIVWGGDNTIETIRHSPLPPRSSEIQFADRFSMAVIDSDAFLALKNTNEIAEKFYNDTYLSDQNACTSPRIIVWYGNRKNEAKELFWDKLHTIVKNKYKFQDIQAVNKLISTYMAAVVLNDVIITSNDNILTRIQVNKMNKRLLDLLDNSGFFFEYDSDDVMELWDICNDKRCQTIGVLGDKRWLMPLVEKGVKGIDRIVGIGHTMDFDLIWDGYDLMKSLTREIVVKSIDE